MSGTLTYSPADILRRALIALGQGTDPVSPSSAQALVAWPIYCSLEPGEPDNAITVYDTVGRDDGRFHTSGERQEHHGIQIRVRSDTHVNGWTKARAIAVDLDQSINFTVVAVEGVSFIIHSVSRTGDVFALGKESPTSKRSVFVINTVLTVRQR